MADSKDFTAGIDSNAKRSPRRVVFVTRRTSAQVKAETEDQVQTFPEVLFRAAVAVMTLAIVLVWIALMFNAPLEGLADPSHTPNPAKAPWYFLGLQEMSPLLSSGRRGCVSAGIGCNGLDCHSLFQGQHRSRRIVLKRPTEAPAHLLRGGSPAFCISRLVPRCGCPGTYVDRRLTNDCGIPELTSVGFSTWPLLSCEAAFLLGHDVVLSRTGGAHRYRHIFPWAGLVLGLAVARLIRMIITTIRMRRS